jgi:segregation and condensation protein B
MTQPDEPPVPPAPRPPLPPDRLTDDVRDEARRAIEAIVLVTEQPIAPQLLGQLLELRPTIVEDLCRELAAEYDEQGRGFQLVRVAGGWRFQSHPAQAAYVERFVLEGQSAKLSAAALETLAIVAYKQPISRAQVASIRGVSVDGVMRTLQQRGYIAEVGRDPGPGQAVMFGTTSSFLETLGIDGLADLPGLGDFVPSATVVEQLERGLRPDGPTAPSMADLDEPGLDGAGLDGAGLDGAGLDGTGLDGAGLDGAGLDEPNLGESGSVTGDGGEAPDAPDVEA